MGTIYDALAKENEEFRVFVSDLKAENKAISDELSKLRAEKMNFTEQNRQYENIQHDRESKRIETAENKQEHYESTAGKDPDAWSHKAEESIEMKILRYNIEAVKRIYEAMGINREGTK